jgi:hypothetical protein|tara:strand:- start:807 stop:1010 length:204 start_codon:yes stop_codon:yes gene_type:complete
MSDLFDNCERCKKKISGDYYLCKECADKTPEGAAEGHKDYTDIERIEIILEGIYDVLLDICKNTDRG